jgi:hypothetical protein
VVKEKGFEVEDWVQKRTVVDAAAAHCCYATEEVMAAAAAAVAVVWADHVALSKHFLSSLIE